MVGIPYRIAFHLTTLHLVMASPMHDRNRGRERTRTRNECRRALVGSRDRNRVRVRVRVRVRKRGPGGIGGGESMVWRSDKSPRQAEGGTGRQEQGAGSLSGIWGHRWLGDAGGDGHGAEGYPRRRGGSGRRAWMGERRGPSLSSISASDLWMALLEQWSMLDARRGKFDAHSSQSSPSL